MAKQAYLILVDAPNDTAPQLGNNKYYKMEDNGDGTFTARWGRVGGHETSKVYPMSKWESTLRSKKRKGYDDQTEFHVVKTGEVVVDHEDPLVLNLLEDLYNASRGRASREYNLASFGVVTQPMLDAAQALIDEIALAIKDLQNAPGLDYFKSRFLRLYTIIPRQMGNVSDFLPYNLASVNNFIEAEQETLESLRGQVMVAETGTKVSLLDGLGISIKPVQFLPAELEKSDLRYRRGFEVDHPMSNRAFEPYVEMGKKLLYHGSRKPNWLSILKTGLQIRPAAHGTNFGNGIYFAESYYKSRNYTDAYMGVYEVALGRKYSVSYRDHSLSLDSIKGDSVVADSRVTGHVEYVIFRPAQCRIKYLLDVR